MSLPRISIVTPSFRSEKYIESTIRSLVSQGYPELEYIVLDGAGDSTADILRRYDEHIHFWRSAPDEGQYAAITEGFAMASGEVLGWLNADDILLPRALFVVGEIFAQFPQVEWITTMKPGILDANGSLAHFGFLPGFNSKAFLDGFYLPGTAAKGFFIQQESTFFRRSLWEPRGRPDSALSASRRFRAVVRVLQAHRPLWRVLSAIGLPHGGGPAFGRRRPLSGRMPRGARPAAPHFQLR
jgi:glycosyltransferase involved in cell wall biosynthesis